jgi:3-ketosteroid 9alpha-monooxygenase subunit A
MSKMPGFPHSGFPEGWFGLGWSSDFPIGSVTARRYFGDEIAIFRTESGRLVASRAYCPHMGARLDVGGKVEGECIRCPFHAWKWDADGKNVDIPYALRPMNARLKIYSIVESGRIVWIWHSWRSADPLWPAPDLAFLEDEQYFWDDAASRRQWDGVRVVPQMVAENIVDGPHIQYVHLSAEGGHIANIEERGPVFHVEVDQTFRTRRGPILGKTFNESLGVGTQISKMNFGDYGVVNVLCTTPVEEDRSDMRASIFITLPEGLERPASAAELPPKLQTLIRSHLDSQEQDLPLWETMIYEPHPLLAGEEIQGHVKLRRWAKQFYQAA